MEEVNTIKEEALELFRKVIRILDRHNIEYWLDQGSLLGAVRDGAFLPWDHDVDIGVWHQDIQKNKKSLVRELRRNAINVDFFPYMIITHYQKKKNGENIKNVPVHLKFYFKEHGSCSLGVNSQNSGNEETELAVSKFHSIVDLTPSKETYKKAVTKLIKKSRSLGFICAEKVRQQHYLSPLFKTTYVANLIINTILINCREPLKNRTVVFKVSSEFFKKLKKINIYGIDVNIPFEAEKYLRLKYGKDWRTPKQNWVWWEEDGALNSVEYK